MSEIRTEFFKFCETGARIYQRESFQLNRRVQLDHNALREAFFNQSEGSKSEVASVLRRQITRSIFEKKLQYTKTLSQQFAQNCAKIRTEL